MHAHPEGERHADRDRLWRLVHGHANGTRSARTPGATTAGPRSDRPVAQVLERLCQVAVSELELMGAAVTLPPRPDAHVVVAASDDDARLLEEMQFDTGEGPTLEACRLRLPVLVPDLASRLDGQWPGFSQAAAAAGVAAAYALPLHVGASLLGALTFYTATAEPMSRLKLRTAFVLGEIAVETLVDDVLGADAVGDSGDTLDSFRPAIDGQAHIYQAQGMVMIQLQVTLTEALARMRAHAYAHDLTLDELSTAILNGAICFSESGGDA